MVKDNKIVIYIISLGFLLSAVISINNIIIYDKNITSNNGIAYHQMIKADAYRYLSHGNEIKEQLNEGVNFFKTGREHYTKYLPPRIMAAYYYIFDKNMFSDLDTKKIQTGIHLPYLLFQSLIYYLAIIFLYFTISKKINKTICIGIIFFLCFEPTILQYHSSFWSESIFFTIQIFIISCVLKTKQTNFNFFIIGILLATLSLQKEYSIFYIAPLSIYFFITLANSKFKKLIIMFIGFFLIQSILGYNNYKRSGEFYIMTADSKINLHIDLVKKVIKKKFEISGKEFNFIEGEATYEWLEKNSIVFNKIDLNKKDYPGFMEYRSVLNEKDKIKFDNFIRSRTIEYIVKYPGDFIKYVINRSFHIVLLNPFHIYSDNNFMSGEVYYDTETHKKLIPYRIFYTLIIYSICLFGLINFYKKKEYKDLIYLIISIFYFYSLVSWHGNTRYFMPVVIYLSFFFGYGIHYILKSKKNLFNT